MAEGIDAAALLTALGRRGYFRTVDFEPALFAEVARDAFTAGESQAIEALCESGLAAFMYSQDPSLHPKDVVDHWRVGPTAAGSLLLIAEGVSFDRATIIGR